MSADARELEVGDLVVAPGRPALGVGRLVALVSDEAGARFGRVHFYDDGQLLTLPDAELSPAPPGVWDKGE